MGDGVIYPYPNRHEQSLYTKGVTRDGPESARGKDGRLPFKKGGQASTVRPHFGPGGSCTRL